MPFDFIRANELSMTRKLKWKQNPSQCNVVVNHTLAHFLRNITIKVEQCHLIELLVDPFHIQDTSAIRILGFGILLWALQTVSQECFKIANSYLLTIFHDDHLTMMTTVLDEKNKNILRLILPRVWISNSEHYDDESEIAEINFWNKHRFNY